MKLALVLHVAAVIAARPKIARNIRTLDRAGDRRRRRGGAADRAAARPRHRPGDLRHDRRDARRRRAADAPARPRRPASAPSLVMLFALFEPYRRARLTSFLDPWEHAAGGGLPGRPGADRDRLGRHVRPRPGRSRSRRSSTFPRPTPTSSSPSSARSSAWRASSACCALYGIIAYAGLRTASNAKGVYAKLARRRPHLTDPVPSPAQRLRRPRPRAADRRPAAVHLLGLDVADRAAGRDGAAAQRRRRAARRTCAPSRSARRPTRERAAEDRDRGRGDGGPRGAGDRGRRRAAS